MVPHTAYHITPYCAYQTIPTPDQTRPYHTIPYSTTIHHTIIPYHYIIPYHTGTIYRNKPVHHSIYSIPKIANDTFSIIKLNMSNTQVISGIVLYFMERCFQPICSIIYTFENFMFYQFLTFRWKARKHGMNVDDEPMENLYNCEGNYS